MVVPRGNAPWSSGYQPVALLLSYETGMIINGCQGWTCTNTVRFNPALRDYFDTTWQWHRRQGFAPASFRLEVGGLVHDTTAAN